MVGVVVSDCLTVDVASLPVVVELVADSVEWFGCSAVLFADVFVVSSVLVSDTVSVVCYVFDVVPVVCLVLVADVVLVV